MDYHKTLTMGIFQEGWEKPEKVWWAVIRQSWYNLELALLKVPGWAFSKLDLPDRWISALRIHQLARQLVKIHTSRGFQVRVNWSRLFCLKAICTASSEKCRGSKICNHEWQFWYIHGRVERYMRLGQATDLLSRNPILWNTLCWKNRWSLSYWHSLN